MNQDDNYKQRMQRKKSHIDAMIASANINKGVIVLLTGNGKGKSSSALGMVCRALGYGMKVAVVKFLKGEQATGEDKFLSNQPTVEIVLMKTGFTWDTQDKSYDTKKAVATWQKALEFLQNPTVDLVVLDELTYMINYKYLKEDLVLEALKNRPTGQHIVITGRAASKALLKISDTVSEINDIKHAFRAGVKAQNGVDI